MLVLANLRHGVFPGGFLRISDEAKVQLIFSFKSFILVWATLSYSEDFIEKFFGMHINANHEALSKKIN